MLQNKKSIIFLDSPFSLNEIKKLIQNNDYKIITFDYNSHKILLDNKIEHKISDEYLTDSELQNIQKNSYSFAQWFNESSISGSLLYDTVNLGELFYVEFHYFLVPFLKKFSELQKIFKDYPNCNYLCTQNLFEIVKSFTDNVKTLTAKNNIEDEYLYDSFKLPFKIGNYTFFVTLPRTFYLKLKGVSELIIDSFFGPRRRFSDSKKSILLVEFDTFRYRRIFSLLPNSSLNLMFYCRRRPSIWNFSTFSIIKNSNCSIGSHRSIADKNIKKSTELEISKIRQKTKLLWKNTSFFKTFFSINGQSFWNIIEPNFIELYEKRINEAIYEIELTKLFFKKYKFDTIVIWNENGFNEKIIIKIAKQFKISIILVQHGLGYDTMDALDWNTHGGDYPVYSDKYAVWGKPYNEYLKKCNVLPKKIEVVGSLLHDIIFERKNNSKNFKNDFILLATSSPVTNIANDLTVKSRENYELTIKQICQIVSKMNKKLVIKLRPFKNEIDITHLTKEFGSQVKVIKSGDILDLIQSCEVFLSLDLSTTILEAQILKKPTISISAKDWRFGIPEIFEKRACLKIDIDEFEKTLFEILNDNISKNKLISNATKFIEYYLSNHGNATKKFLSFLEKF